MLDCFSLTRLLLYLGTSQVFIDRQATSFWSIPEKTGLKDKSFLRNIIAAFFLYVSPSHRKTLYLYEIHLGYHCLSLNQNNAELTFLYPIRSLGKWGPGLTTSRMADRVKEMLTCVEMLKLMTGRKAFLSNTAWKAAGSAPCWSKPEQLMVKVSLLPVESRDFERGSLLPELEPLHRE